MSNPILTILSFSFLCFPVFLQAQPLIAFNSQEPSFISPCGDSIEFAVLIDNEGDMPLAASTLQLMLPAGINYVSGSVTGVAAFDLSDLNAPVFSLGQLPDGDAIIISLLAESDCSLLNNPGPYQNEWIIDGPDGLFSYTTSPYNVNLPSLVTSNLVNINFVGQIGDNFSRSFTISNAGFGPVSNLYLEDVFSASIAVTNAGPGQFQVVGNTASLHLDADDFMMVGDGDGLLEQGESITITEEVSMLECQPAEDVINIAWGCNDEACESIDLNTSVIVPTELPILEWSFLNADFAGFCEPGQLEILVENTTSPTMATAFDMVLEPGMASPGNSLPGHESCIQLTDFAINGQALSSDTVNFNGYGIPLQQLMSDPDGPGGLTDLDGDGIFDDLPFGESFVLTASVVVDNSCLGDDCVISLAPLAFKLRQYYQNQCELEGQSQPINDSYVYEWPGISVSNNIEPNYENGELVDLIFQFQQNLIGFDCPNPVVELTIDLPPSMELQAGANLLLNGSSVAFSQVNNSLTINTSLTDFSLVIPVETGCDTSYQEVPGNPCAIVDVTPAVYTVDFSSSFFCSPLCLEPVDIYCGSSQPFIVRCEADLSEPDEGISAFRFFGERRSFGWTDNTLTTKVDENTPGIALDHAMVFDTVQFEVDARVFGPDEYADSRFYLFYFNGQDDPYFDHLAGALTLFDEETATNATCPLPLPDLVSLGGAHSMTFDISQLFLPGACLDGFNVTENDSIQILMDVVMQEDALPVSLSLINGLSVGFQFTYNGQLLTCNEEQLDYYLTDPGLVFETELETTDAACDSLTFKVRLNQGRNQVGDIDPFPFEHRPLSGTDSLYLDIPDNLVYLPGSAMLSYETRPDMTADGPVALMDLPITDPQILPLPGNRQGVLFDNIPDFLSVDIVKSQTLNQISFRVHPQCMDDPSIDFEGWIDYRNYAYDLNENQQVFRPFSQVTNYTLGDRSLTVFNPIFEGVVDTAVWVMELCNIPISGFTPLSIPNSFLLLELPLTGLQPISVENVSDPNNPVMYPLVPFGPDGAFLVQLGDFPANTCLMLEFSAVFDSCEPVAFPISFDFDCTAYPQNPSDLNNSCSLEALTDDLSMVPVNAALQINMTNFPANPVSLCESLEYELLVINTQPGRAYDVVVSLELPSPGLSIVPGSCELDLGNAGFVSIPDPVQIGGTDFREWDMEQISAAIAQNGLGGLGQGIPSEFVIRFEVETFCDFANLSTIAYQTSWTNACASNDSTALLFSPAIQVAGVPLTLNTYDIDWLGTPIQSCASGSGFTLNLTNTGSEVTSSSEVVQVIIDPALDYVVGSATEIQNWPSPGEPLNFISAGSRVLEWFLPDGVAIGEDLGISFQLVNIQPNNLNCSDTPVEIVLQDEANVPCATAPGGSCELAFELSGATFSIGLESADYALQILNIESVIVDVDTENWTTEYQVSNSGVLDGAGNLIIEFYHDVNGNGSLEIGTDLWVGIDSFLTDDLGPGQDTLLQTTFDVEVSNACDLLLAVIHPDTNACVCDTLIHVLDPPGVNNAGAADTLCLEQTINIGEAPQSGFTYTWIPDTYLSDPFIANPDYEYTGPFPNGNTVTDTLLLETVRAGGCISIDTLILTINLLEANVVVTSNYNGFGVSCVDASDGSLLGSLNGGVEPLSWDWTPTLPDVPNPTDLTAGNYQFTVTDAIGCSAEASVEILAPGPLENQFSLSDYNGFNISCFGESDGSILAETSGGVGSYNYNWSGGSGNPNLGLPSGEYYLTITDANACEFLDTLVLSEPSLLELDLSSSPILCEDGSNGVIELTATGGIGPYDYSGNIFNPDFSITGLDMAGNYAIEILDANGCSAAGDVNVEQLISTFELSSEPIICPSGEEGSICVLPLDAYYPLSYSWQGGGADSCLISLGAGTYEVTVTDANGCLYALEETLNEPDPFAVSTEIEDVSCFGLFDGSILSVAVGGTAPYTYQWTGGLAGPQIFDLPAGVYELTLTDAEGCTFNTNAVVSSPPELSISLSVMDVNCFEGSDGSILANGNGGTPPFSFNWSNAGNSEVIDNLSAGIYTLTLTDAQGCEAESSGQVNQPPSLMPDYEETEITCFGFADGQIEVIDPIGDGFTYSLNGSDFQEDPLFSGLDFGSYVLTIQTPEGCMYDYPAFIDEPNQDLIFVSPDTTILLGESTNIQAFPLTNILSYAWLPPIGLDCPDCPATDAAPLQNTLYTVTVISEKGCVAEESVWVRVITEPDVYIPNIFTPDFDGINDAFLVFGGPSVAQVLELKIFDRWGGMMFEGLNFLPNDPSSGWDGTVGGKKAEHGVYVYYAIVEFIDGRRELFKGDVTLIR